MAGSRTYRTKVLVLDKTKLKETDLILTMLDERGRQVRAVAKGARKPGGRLAARCELFCTVDMLLAHGRSLDIVSQAELLEAPLGAAPDYEATGAELVSTSEVAWLRALMSMTFDELMDQRIDPHTAAFLLGLSHIWAATHTDQRLRAMEFMLGR